MLRNKLQVPFRRASTPFNVTTLTTIEALQITDKLLRLTEISTELACLTQKYPRDFSIRRIFYLNKSGLTFEVVFLQKLP